MLFDNCLILAPDDAKLSRCSREKIGWYLSKGIAEKISDNPLTIRLKFEPSGREGQNDPFLTNGKPNHCVVCGTTKNLSRHHVVPKCFVRYLELKYIMDTLHDIMPLCRPCHGKYETFAWQKKKQMSQELGIDIHGTEPKLVVKVNHAISAARTLLKHKDKIPEFKYAYLMKPIQEFYHKSDISDEEIKKLSIYKIKYDKNYVSFGKYVVSKIENINEFAKDWREHFVSSMKPQFLPEYFSVDRDCEKAWLPKRFKTT